MKIQNALTLNKRTLLGVDSYIRNVKSNNWERFDGKLWQRNYWEHIIRNEDAYYRIAQYIKSNPKNWQKDTLRKNVADH